MKHIIDTDKLEKLIINVDAFDNTTYPAIVDIKALRTLIASSPQADDVVKDAEKWRSHEKELQLELLNALNLNEQ